MANSWFYLELDTTPPKILNIKVFQTMRYFTMITCDCDKESNIIIYYGEDVNDLSNMMVSNCFCCNPYLELTKLKPNTLYYFKIEAVDEVLNRYYDVGTYSFKTLAIENVQEINYFEDVKIELEIKLISTIENKIENIAIIETIRNINVIIENEIKLEEKIESNIIKNYKINMK